MGPLVEQVDRSKNTQRRHTQLISRHTQLINGTELDMGMFDKLVQKGKQAAGEYVKDQLSQRRGQQRSGSNPPGGYGQGPAYAGQYPPPNVQPRRPEAAGPAPQHAGAGADADRAAIAKYQYMLRTAPPEDMERAHTEAFARLTPQQRALLRTELDGQMPPSERPRSDRPEDLARSATRAEVSRPGFMEKILAGGSQGRGGGRGIGGGLAAGAAGGLGAGLLAGVAGAFIGSAVAGPLLEGFSGVGEELAGAAGGFGEDITAAGEGFTEQTGGLFDGFLGGGGSGDWEL